MIPESGEGEGDEEEEEEEEAEAQEGGMKKEVQGSCLLDSPTKAPSIPQANPKNEVNGRLTVLFVWGPLKHRIFLDEEEEEEEEDSRVIRPSTRAPQCHS